MSDTESEKASNMLMDCADYFAATLTKADPRAWEHLLIYVPKDQLLRRADVVRARDEAREAYWLERKST